MRGGGDGGARNRRAVAQETRAERDTQREWDKQQKKQKDDKAPLLV